MDVHPMALFVAAPLMILGLLGVLVMRATSQRRPGADHHIAPWSVWLPTLFLSGLFMISGWPKLGGSAVAVNAFEGWGYGQELMLFIGGVEFLCALFLLIPELATLAALALTAVMVGSFMTHVMVGEYAMMFVPLLVIPMLLFVAIKRAGHLTRHLPALPRRTELV